MGLAERIRSRVAQVGRMKAMSYTVGTSAAVSFLWLFWGAQNPPSWVHDLKLDASIMTSLVLLRTSGADDPKTVREYSVLKYMQSLAESSPQGRKVLITSGLWKSALNSIKDNRYQIHDKIRKIVEILKLLTEDQDTAQAAISSIPVTLMQEILRNNEPDTMSLVDQLVVSSTRGLREKLAKNGEADSGKELSLLVTQSDISGNVAISSSWDFDKLLLVFKEATTVSTVTFVATLLLHSLLSGHGEREAHRKALSLIRVLDQKEIQELISSVDTWHGPIFHWCITHVIGKLCRELQVDADSSSLVEAILPTLSRFTIQLGMRSVVNLTSDSAVNPHSLVCCKKTADELIKLLRWDVKLPDDHCNLLLNLCLDLSRIASMDTFQNYGTQLDMCALSLISMVEKSFSLQPVKTVGKRLQARLTNFGAHNGSYKLSETMTELASSPEGLVREYVDNRKSVTNIPLTPLWDSLVLLDSQLRQVDPYADFIRSSARCIMDHLIHYVADQEGDESFLVLLMLQLWASSLCERLNDGRRIETDSISQSRDALKIVEKAMTQKVLEVSEEKQSGGKGIVAKIPEYFRMKNVPSSQSVSVTSLCHLFKALVFASDTDLCTNVCIREGLPILCKATLSRILAIENTRGTNVSQDIRKVYSCHENMKLVRNSTRIMANMMYHCSYPALLRSWELSSFEDWYQLLCHTLQAADLKTVCHSRRAAINLAKCASSLGEGNLFNEAPYYGDMIYPLVDNTRDSPSSKGPKVDLVFIHGLQGTALKTWRCPKLKVHDHMLGLWKMVQENIDQGQDIPDTEHSIVGSQSKKAGEHAMALKDSQWNHIASEFDQLARSGVWKHDDAELVVNGRKMPLWPVSWLPYDLLQKYNIRCRIICVEYDAKLWEGSGYRPTLSMEQAANRVKSQLEHARVGSQKDQPVIYITHSMGGLITKEMLRKAYQLSKVEQADDSTFEKESSLVSQCAGLVFISVPHKGSPLANYVRHTQWPLIRSYLSVTPPVQQLRENNNFLKELNEDFIHLVSHREADTGSQIPCLSIAEGTSSKVSSALPAVHIVPPENAYPGTGEILTVKNANHVTVCKPSSREDMRYIAIRDFIGNSVGES